MKNSKLYILMVLALLLTMLAVRAQPGVFASPITSPVEPIPDQTWSIPDGQVPSSWHFDLIEDEECRLEKGASGMVLVCSVSATPMPTPTPTSVPQHPKPTMIPTLGPPIIATQITYEYLRTDLWMGRCKMWTDGIRVTRIECPKE